MGMGSSKVKKKYALQEVGENVTNNYTSNNNNTISDDSRRQVKRNGENSSSMKQTRKSKKHAMNSLSTWGSKNTNTFPDVHSKKKTHKEILPDWAIPKFSKWESHHTTKAEEEQVNNVRSTLSHCLAFSEENRERLARDKILSPRTLFSEIFTKPLNQITERECYILETFISEHIIRWDRELHATIKLQKIWRGHHGKRIATNTRQQKLLYLDIMKADRRRKYDEFMSKKMLHLNNTSTLPVNEELRKEKERMEDEKQKRQEKATFMYQFIACGGLREQGNNVDLKDYECFQDPVSQRKLYLLLKTMNRINNASLDESAWLGVKRREFFKLWVVLTKRMHFYRKASLWNLRSWFDKWDNR
jgi:hypothetical protein